MGVSLNVHTVQIIHFHIFIDSLNWRQNGSCHLPTIAFAPVRRAKPTMTQMPAHAPRHVTSELILLPIY